MQYHECLDRYPKTNNFYHAACTIAGRWKLRDELFKNYRVQGLTVT
jgi:hypothetical protein